MVDFRLFVQIAETNSLRQGADLVCLSAPAASARIANLEARTATKLLVRSSKGVTLTTAGQAFLHHAKLILEQIEALNGDLEEYAKSVKGHLRVAANPTALKEFLPGMLGKYLASHKDVRLDLRELLSSDIVRSVSAGTSDVGILLGSTRTEDLEVISYRETRLVLVTALDHPLAESESASFADALQFEFVDFPEASPTFAPVHRAADALAVRVRTRVRAVNIDSLCRLVEAGVGVGVAPEPSARRMAKSASIAVIPIVDEGAVLAGRICARTFKALPSFARDFVSALLADCDDPPSAAS
jgi:DNA-binding transcriptional LysR family regulator